MGLGSRKGAKWDLTVVTPKPEPLNNPPLFFSLLDGSTSFFLLPPWRRGKDGAMVVPSNIRPSTSRLLPDQDRFMQRNVAGIVSTLG